MLFFRGVDREGVRVVLTLLRDEGAEPPTLRVGDTAPRPDVLIRRAGVVLWRYEMVLPSAAGAGYTLDGHFYPVETRLKGDLRLAFVSCNGQEHGDLDRPPADRNALWTHLAEDLDARPVHLLLHGGDQVYADEVTQAHSLTEDWPDAFSTHLESADRDAVREALADAFFLRYATQWAQTGYAETVARIPSLAIWDDHDICDGWGSLDSEALDSDTGRLVFETAREAMLLFQFGCAADEHPEICSGPGQGLGWAVTLPNLTLIAPDLRTERRPERVMASEGWDKFRAALDGAPSGRVIVISSVPALGPRLSLVERAMKLTKRMEKYEDDLRDQWQSYAHREEWQSFLSAMLEVHGKPDHAVTVISGEIHLATRGTMACEAGPIHQLVASGITHPAPPWAYARGLGLLARLGEAPLPGHKIRLHPLPGQSPIYTDQRNYLTLTRTDGDWAASWQLEESGATPALAL